MARGFRRHRGGVVAQLDEDERAFVVSVLEQTRELLASPERYPPADEFEAIMSDSGLAEDVDRRQGDRTAAGFRDPALDRLFPSAHRSEPQIAEEFSRLTREGLRERKVARLTQAALALDAAGDQVRLTQPEAEALLVALTDVRLVLGSRLGVQSDEDADRLHEKIQGTDLDDPVVALAVAYDFLTWLQESLAESLLP